MTNLTPSAQRPITVSQHCPAATVPYLCQLVGYEQLLQPNRKTEFVSL